MLLRFLSLVLLFGCEAAAPHAVVTVEDPLGVARTADALQIGSFDEPPVTKPLTGGLPATFLLTHDKVGVLPIQVDALSAGEVVARAAGEVDLSAGAAQLTLQRPCGEDAECDDDDFCTGVERCIDGICAGGGSPCSIGTSLEGCVSAGTCDPATKSCRFELFPGIDDGNACTLDLCDGTHVPLEDGACVAQGRPGRCIQGTCTSTSS